MNFLPFVAVTTLAVITGCSSDSSTQLVPANDNQNEATLASNPFDIAPQDDPSAPADPSSVNTFQGEIGLIIDARKVANLGYTPRSAKVKVSDTYDTADGSQEWSKGKTIQLGTNSFMGTYKLSVAELDPAVLLALDDGAEVSLSLFESVDASDDSIIVEDYLLSRVVLQANPLPFEISTLGLESRNLQFTLSPDTEYFIQHVNGIGQFVGYGMKFQTPTGRNVFIHANGMPIDNPQAASTDKWLYRFYPIPGEPNTYAIQYRDSNQYLKVTNDFMHYNAWQNDWTRGGRHNALRLTNEKEGVNEALNIHGDWMKFIVEQEAPGIFVMRSKKKGTLLRRIQGDSQYGNNQYWGLSFGTNHTTRPSDFIYRSYQRVSGNWVDRGDQGHIPLSPFYFRIINNNIDWNIQSVGSEMIQTIIPEPRIGIAYETDEDNCGSGKLITTTGIDRAAETTVGAEFQESFSLLSSQTNTLGWKMGVEVGGSPGPKYSAEISGEHSWHSENSQTTTETTVQSSSETISFSSTKQVTVKPGTNSRVVAAYEVYDDIKAQFVQRFQIRGTDKETQVALSGDEIATQLRFTNFSGVVTGTGPDVAEFTLRGEATVNNLIKGRTTITEKAIDCL